MGSFDPDQNLPHVGEKITTVGRFRQPRAYAMTALRFEALPPLCLKRDIPAFCRRHIYFFAV